MVVEVAVGAAEVRGATRQTSVQDADMARAGVGGATAWTWALGLLLGCFAHSLLAYGVDSYPEKDMLFDVEDAPPLNPLEGVSLTVSWDGSAGEGEQTDKFTLPLVRTMLDCSREDCLILVTQVVNQKWTNPN